MKRASLSCIPLVYLGVYPSTASFQTRAQRHYGLRLRNLSLFVQLTMIRAKGCHPPDQAPSVIGPEQPFFLFLSFFPLSSACFGKKLKET